MRFPTLPSLAVLLFSTAALAHDWRNDQASHNFVLVSGKNALTVECYPQKPQQPPSIALRYWPSCSKSSCGTYIADDNSLGSVILDDKTFGVSFDGGDAEDLGIVAQTATTEAFLDALAKAKTITVYSSHIKPHYATFTNVNNAETLRDYYDTCALAAKIIATAPAPTCHDSGSAAQCNSEDQ